MKTIKNIFQFLAIIVFFTGCLDEYTEEFTANSPIYMSYEDLRDAVEMQSSREIINPGKIYFKDNFIFINEELEGIHIIDNQNPENPQNIGFIEVPGNADIAIKNNVLYADSYVDLVAIDISDVQNPNEISRVEDIFPYTTPPYDEDYRVAKVDEEKGVVIDWEIKKVRQEMEYHYYPVYRFGWSEVDFAADASQGMAGPSGSTFGIGGSMARFGLYNEYLYAVDNNTLHMFDVNDPENPNTIGNQNVGWQIETMFIYDEHVFFGTQNGMLIYSLEVATVPKYVGEFWHITSCDPVVVSDGYAYVTLRGGNQCGSNVNRLDVIQLTDNYTESLLLESYPLNGPYGLGIDDQTLFVCDGDAGLKVYDVTDKYHIDENQIAQFPNINTYDVIPVSGYLFMIGDDGFYQYDYSNLQNIQQISFIPVTTEE
jgi:hypothetical protein